MKRYAARVDGNHAEIVSALKQIGCSVLDLSRVGGGCPDLAVGFRYRNIFLELKNGVLAPSRQALTTPQQIFARQWRGHYGIARNAQDAIDIVIEETSR